MKRGKKYVNAAKLVDKHTVTMLQRQCLVKQTAVAKFDETIEAHIRLGVDGPCGSAGFRSGSSAPWNR